LIETKVDNQELKIKYKVLEKDEKKTETLKVGNFDYTFPNLDDSSSSSKSSKSGSEEEEEEDEDEEDKLPQWDKKSCMPKEQVIINKKKKAIAEHLQEGYGLITTKKCVDKFSFKNLTFINYSGKFYF
jgi:hypothetical protein